VNAVLREITNMPAIRDRLVVKSSVIPSAKYCCSGSLLRFVKGRMTMDSRGGTSWEIGAIAAHDNVAVKISGACTLSHEPFPYKDIWDPLGRVFDAFGFDRCMWGTDWTRAVGMLTYEQGVEAFRATDRLSDSERTALMGGSLQQIYNPKSGS
jgi:predicted TIM-barrel fold metal-dependent hydrolase